MLNKKEVMLIAFGHKLGDTQAVSNYLLPSANEARDFLFEIDWINSIKLNDLKHLCSLSEVISSFESKPKIIKYPTWIELAKNWVISWVNAFLGQRTLSFLF